MTITIHKTDGQQTEKWFKIREENPFSSSVAGVVIVAGSGLLTLIKTKIFEKFSNGEAERFSGADTDRGNELEPQAQVIYELNNSVKIVNVDYITNDKYKYAGTSPDGLVEEDGMVEIKAPADKGYSEFLFELAEKGKITIPLNHKRQMIHQLNIAEREWNDYVLFNPNFKKDFIVQRIYRNDPDAQQIWEAWVVGWSKAVKLLEDYTEKFKKINQ